MARGDCDPQRILVRLPNWVGDAVMATPALRALRRAHPGAEITVEGPAPLAGLLRGLSCFDRFEAAPARGAVALARRVGALRTGNFDWAVLLPDSVRSAWPAYLARVARRAGYARDPLRRALLTDALAPPRRDGRRLPLPMSERYLAIVRQLGCDDAGLDLDLAVDDAIAARVEQRLERLGVGRGDPIAVVTPGAGLGPSKRWPPGHFAAACDGLYRRLGLVPVLVPGPGELSIGREVAASTRERSVLWDDPPADLDALKALIARARLVLSNDSGPRHVAVALGRPVVVVMGPSDPRHTAQHLSRQRVLREDVACSPCGHAVCPIDHRCLTRIRPERVITAAAELLA